MYQGDGGAIKSNTFGAMTLNNNNNNNNNKRRRRGSQYPERTKSLRLKTGQNPLS